MDKKLTDKVAYLQGLAEGMKLTPDTPEHKLLLKMLDVLKDFGAELETLRDEQEALREEQEELSDYVDSIEEDLGDIEELLYDEEDDDDDHYGCNHCQGEEEPLEGEMEYECPHCGYQTKFDLADFDFEEDYLCPKCHKSFFPETEDDEEEDEDEEQEP